MAWDQNSLAAVIHSCEFIGDYQLAAANGLLNYGLVLSSVHRMGRKTKGNMFSTTLLP